MDPLPFAYRRRIVLASLLALLLPLLGSVNAAQPGFEPRVGQAGKDVIWVPTPNSLIDRMLRMVNAGPNDKLVDLGSGDGRIAIAAARDFKVGSAIGIEYNSEMVTLSNHNAVDQGVAQRVNFIQGDLFATDFSDATIVTMYLLPAINLRLRPILLNMKPGTRIVSHAFTMSDWRPDDRASVAGQNAYFWIVPARVAGTWKAQAGAETVELQLTQAFQDFRGTAAPMNAAVQGSLKGDEIRLTLPDGKGGQRELVGKVAGEQITGKLGADSFTANRIAPPAP